MELAQALQESQNVKASIGDVTVLITRPDVQDEPEHNQTYWHHTFHTDNRNLSILVKEREITNVQSTAQ